MRTTLHTQCLTSHRRGGIVMMLTSVLAIIGLVFVLSATNVLMRPVKVLGSAASADMPIDADTNTETTPDPVIPTRNDEKVPGTETNSNHDDPADPSIPETTVQTDPPPAQIITPTPTNTPTTTPLPDVDPSSVEGGITITEARALYNNEAIFIDTRHMDIFKEGHVAGAFRLSLDMVQLGNLGDVGAILLSDPQQTAVVYCAGGTCDESAIVREKLMGLGCPNIKVMVDGYPGWHNAGYETLTGEF